MRSMTMWLWALCDHTSTSQILRHRPHRPHDVLAAPHPIPPHPAGRINSGVKAEIVALTEIPGVRGYRARLLYKAGLRTPEAVAACDVARLTDILSAGKNAGAQGKTEEQARAVERRAARMILQGAKQLLNEKARDLNEQAAAVLAAMQQVGVVLGVGLGVSNPRMGVRHVVAAQQLRSC